MPFQIGLVLSGGATAGSYTAGVIDFLLEALNEWEKETKTSPENCPPWDVVKINNMTASSAGAICTMLTAVTLGTKHEPLSKKFNIGDESPKNNLLYRSWVSEFGQGIFSNDDLPPTDLESSYDYHTIKSVANSNYLRDMAEKFCVPVVPRQPIPSWAQDMKIYLTVTNMNGIPYSAGMTESLNEENNKYRMYKHSDCIGFDTNVGNASDETTFCLNLNNPRKCADWQRMYDVAAASASVPILFPASIVSRPYSHYEEASSTTPKMKADWAIKKPGVYQYNFLAADGGIFNNEPLGICRSVMEKSTKQNMEGSAENCWGACILIDCNATTASTSNIIGSQSTDLLHCASRVFGVMLNEAAFKDSDFFEAMDTRNFSQFLISPTREGRQTGEYILATSTLNLFGGLLDERLRHHDFLLGRRNCQKFLKEHFTIDVARGRSNGNFADIERWAEKSEGHTPIIPLFGSAAEECPLPHWPLFTEEEKKKISNEFEYKLVSRLTALLVTYARNLGLSSPRTVFHRTRIAFMKHLAPFIARFTYSWIRKGVSEALSHFTEDRKEEEQ